MAYGDKQPKLDMKWEDDDNNCLSHRKSFSLAVFCLLFGFVTAYISTLELIRTYIIFHGRNNNMDNENNTGEISLVFPDISDRNYFSTGLNISKSHVICRDFSSGTISKSFTGNELFYPVREKSCVCQASFFKEAGWLDSMPVWNFLMSVIESERQSNRAFELRSPNSPLTIRRYLTYVFPALTCHSLIQAHLTVTYVCCFAAISWLILGVYYAGFTIIKYRRSITYSPRYKKIYTVAWTKFPLLNHRRIVYDILMRKRRHLGFLRWPNIFKSFSSGDSKSFIIVKHTVVLISIQCRGCRYMLLWCVFFDVFLRIASIFLNFFKYLYRWKTSNYRMCEQFECWLAYTLVSWLVNSKIWLSQSTRKRFVIIHHWVMPGTSADICKRTNYKAPLVTRIWNYHIFALSNTNH